MIGKLASWFCPTPSNQDAPESSNPIKAINATSDRVRELKCRGIELRDCGSYDLAKQILLEALNLTEKYSGLDLLQARVLHELAYLEEVRGNARQAAELYHHCLALETRLCDDEGRGATLYQLAHLKDSQRQTEQALKLYEEALAAQRAANDVSGQAASLHQLAHLTQRENVPAAIAYFEELRRIDEASGDRQSQIAALHQMGSLLKQQGNIDQALAVYRESLALSELSEAHLSQASTLAQIADIEKRQGKLSQAETTYRRSLVLLKRLDPSETQNQHAIVLHHLAAIRADLGDVDGAIALYQEALQYEGELHGRAATLTALGYLLVEEKQWTGQGIAYLKQALELLEEIGSTEADQVREILKSVE
ncbi:MAG: tetratricopeptide repeat protein [Elainellaceae cyanobacterium]